MSFTIKTKTNIFDSNNVVISHDRNQNKNIENIVSGLPLLSCLMKIRSCINNMKVLPT